MKPGALLALTLHSNVGYCAGHPGDIAPDYGSWRLSESRLLGPRFVGFENELIAMLDRLKPRLVVMQVAIGNGIAQDGGSLARQQFGMMAYCAGECHRARVQLREVTAGDVRRDVLGKQDVGAWCRANGFRPGDNLQADALALWKHTCAVQQRLAQY